MSESRARILIVDDDEDNRANLADILSDIGFETETASCGDDALEIVYQNRPNGGSGFDLCLLDFKMPGMDGVELFQKIRTVIPKLPAIIITAYAGDDGVQRAQDAGTWKVLRKPVDIQALLGMIDEAVA